jgi:hypothetical protein
MRINTFQNMLTEYGTDIDPDDLSVRQEKLGKLKYSAIIEGNFLEYDNLEKWIEENNFTKIESIFYSKTGYDYGFWEYFFESESDCERFKNKIPDIYTQYPNGTCSKSDGYGNDIPKP